jgi:hypothetical protein
VTGDVGVVATVVVAGRGKSSVCEYRELLGEVTILETTYAMARCRSESGEEWHREMQPRTKLHLQLFPKVASAR